MSDWPPVWILFITFRRTDFALQTIASLKAHLKYPSLHWHICDDGSKVTDDGTERNHVEVLAEAIGGDVTWHEMDTPLGEFDMGGNTNRGIGAAQEAGCHLYFLVHDDTVLRANLDISPHVCTLESYPVGMMRYNYLAPGLAGIFTKYRAEKLGTDHTYVRLIRDWSLKSSWGSDGYVHAFQPSLVHQKFYDAYGYYRENLYPGLTETAMCTQYNDSPLGEDGPQILIPVHLWPLNVEWHHFNINAHYYKAFVEGA